MEYYITARSFAAPFVSDKSDAYVEASSPKAALEQFAANYTHPCGLYAAEAWLDHKHMRSGSEPLARYLSHLEQAVRKATADKTAYSFLRLAPEKFEIDGELFEVADPTAGSVV